ncbi:MAG: hypothetical protein EOP07_05545 [Proteobacteria bacterium]|nr:MAG: hypothetical protein EOP07_05545 [Pseudomonadota bacterium]
MKLKIAAGLGLFFLLQSSIAEARSLMERLDQLIFGRSKDLSAAYDAYDHGKFEEAAKDFAAYASGPQSNQVATYNAAVASYKAGKPDDAMKFLQRAAAGSDPKIKARALHNTASIHIDKKELEPARDSLKEALSFDNDNKAIRENLEWVEEQLKNQPPKKDQDKKDSQKQADDKDKDKKDQEKSEDQKKEEQNASNKENDPKKDGQPKDQDKGQDQKSAEEKKAEEEKSKAEQKSAEEKKAEQDKESGKSKEQMAKEQDAKKDEKSKEQEAQAAQEQKDKDKDKDPAKDAQKQAQAAKPEEGKAPESPEGKKAQAVLTQAELKQQEAERLLRSIDDKIGRYPLTDTEATGQRGKDGKNW